MNKLGITAIAAVMTLAFSAGVVAINLSNDDYKARKAGIAAQYKSDRAGCGSFSANARDVCVAEAKGRENVARAELEAEFKPSEDARYKVRVARADANLSVAMEKCDNAAGNVKDVCVKKAKAAAVAAKADAEVLLTTANANQVADDKAAAAQLKADEKSAAARKDATTDKRNADYAVAREKCDTFAGDVKAVCVKEAKARFGQS
jgi:hypothetical protein